MLVDMVDNEQYIKCVETHDLEGQLDYWKRKYDSLINRTVPPWHDCREAIENIERLEAVINDK
jgi:hypothetical protein|tara:strand:- start:17046 stop:17234 length:189 start_codon:yes stop_codon:yes gene_type:complete